MQKKIYISLLIILFKFMQTVAVIKANIHTSEKYYLEIEHNICRLYQHGLAQN